MPTLIQTALACGCGSPDLYKGDVCLRCHRRARLSRADFAGLRERCLQRDGYLCRGCRTDRDLLVHHRRPGVNELDSLITLCRACHVRIHRTWRPSFEFLSLAFWRRLWREANQDLAEQRLLSLLVEAETERGPERQLGLFDGA